jgi:hypothetical protein
MIHRPFLLKSFQTPLYLFTRRTCVSAAMTILREHELVDQDDQCWPLWVHSAFAVTAVVVLCLNIIYVDGDVVQSNCDLETQRHLVQKTRDRLATQNADSLARRGVYLIDVLLDESHSMPRTRLRLGSRQSHLVFLRGRKAGSDPWPGHGTPGAQFAVRSGE